MITKTEPKFLFSIDPTNRELYILHRQYPSCLIWVKQETPVRFIIQDLYEDMPDDEFDTLPIMPFVQEAKDFFKQYGEAIMGGN